ncbi:MAG: metallophosphoesterase [Myxococcota bacterium]|nr:metallophosphoesterase [Myxococcota bacterium]
MSTLYVGDVHGCAEELDELLNLVGPEVVVMVGDLFSKGPDPQGVYALLSAWGARSVLGNHDAWLLERGPGDCVNLKMLVEETPGFLEWLASLPLFLEEPRCLVVHAGLHPVEGVLGTSREMALTLRRWPDDSSESHPFWYDAGWEGPATVVFGHDARRGIVRRENRGLPIAVGLDSGCVYGGRLTGWLDETDELVSVPARRSYKPV